MNKQIDDEICVSLWIEGFRDLNSRLRNKIYKKLNYQIDDELYYQICFNITEKIHNQLYDELRDNL